MTESRKYVTGPFECPVTEHRYYEWRWSKFDNIKILIELNGNKCELCNKLYLNAVLRENISYKSSHCFCEINTKLRIEIISMTHSDTEIRPLPEQAQEWLKGFL